MIFSPGTHTCTPRSLILIYGGLIIKWSSMCSHCPHIALNGYMNLGHICMPALLDYVEFPTWWFKAITHRRHRSNVSSGYIRGVFYIHMDPPRLCCADFWDRLMSFSCADCNLSSFVASFFFFFFFGWVFSLEMRQQAARLSLQETQRTENRTARRPCQKACCELI